MTQKELDIENRIFNDAYNETMRDENFQIYQSKIGALGRKIMEFLGSNKAIFLEYERLMGLAQGINQEKVYDVGFEDGKLYNEKTT